MALTKVTGQVIKDTTDVTVGVLTVTNTLAVGGTVSIGGTLTYEDVTNVDAVGLITARDGIVVGSGITLSVDGDIFATGVTTVATLKVTTGIVTTLTATTGIVTTLTANTVTSLGAVSGTTGTFSGAVSGTTGTFTGDVDIADKIIHTGDTNTALRFPSADTITAETGGSEKARIDSSGRLLIGNTDGATYADTSADDLIIGSTAGGKNDGITILSGTSQNGTILFADSGGSSRGLVGYVHNGDYLRLHAGATLKARIDTDGLKFNSDTASANALDDYEEGTWTPSTTEGMNNVYGAHYVKVGAKVSVQAYITMPTSTSGNNIRIDSFPFTSKGSNHYAIGTAYSQWSGTDHIFLQLASSGTHAYVYRAVGSSVTFNDGSGGYFLFSLTYFTA